MLHFYDKRDQILSNFKLEVKDAPKTILLFCVLFHSHSYRLTKMDIFALDFTYYSRALAKLRWDLAHGKKNTAWLGS